MKTYQGRRENGAAIVTVDGQTLPPRLDLWKYSENGFEWGQDSRGSAQLAIALLADHLCDDARTIDLHQDFNQIVVTKLPRSWSITSNDIEKWLQLLATR